MTKSEAIRILTTRDNQGNPITWQTGFLEAYGMAIEALKADVPEKNTGKWIHGKAYNKIYVDNQPDFIDYEDWRCSECGIVFEQSEKPVYKYCPCCGVKMEVEE